jgi:hypothetical protein
VRSDGNLRAGHGLYGSAPGRHVTPQSFPTRHFSQEGEATFRPFGGVGISALSQHAYLTEYPLSDLLELFELLLF